MISGSTNIQILLYVCREIKMKTQLNKYNHINENVKILITKSVSREQIANL